MTDSANVTALSYIGVQVFGHTHFRWFTYISSKTAQLVTYKAGRVTIFELFPPVPPLYRDDKSDPRRDLLEFESMTEGVKRIRDAIRKYEGE